MGQKNELQVTLFDVISEIFAIYPSREKGPKISTKTEGLCSTVFVTCRWSFCRSSHFEGLKIMGNR